MAPVRVDCPVQPSQPPRTECRVGKVGARTARTPRTKAILHLATPVIANPTVLRSCCRRLTIPSGGSFCRLNHERGQFSPANGRRFQFFENLVRSDASEWSLVPLLRLVRRHSTTDDGSLIRCQFHDRNLTELLFADAASSNLRLCCRE